MIGPTNAHGGGGALNLKVVGGTTQPTNPRENTIWINTSVAITGYVLSPTQPETGTEGLVWLRTAEKGIEINVDRKGRLLIHLNACTMYTSEGWQIALGYAYVSDKWKTINTYIALIKGGTMIAEFKNTSGSRLIQQSGYVAFSGTGAGYHTMWVDDVDLTGSTTLFVEGEFNPSGAASGTGFVIGIWDNNTTDMKYTNAKAVASYYKKTSATLDISSYSGKFKVGFASVYTCGNKIKTFEIT